MVAVNFVTNGLFTFTENAGVTGDLTPHAGTKSATLTDTNTGANPPSYEATFVHSPADPFDPNFLPGAIDVQISSSSGPGGTTGSVDFNFSVADNELDFLRQGEVRHQHILVTITDNNGGDSIQKDIEVDITGANDAPTAHVDLHTISENVTTATFGVLGNDTDPDHGDTKQLTPAGFSVFSVTSAADPYLTKAMVHAVRVNFANNALPAKDAIQFTLDRAFQGLATGESAHIVIKYGMVDGFGATSASQLQVTVVGSNDAQIVGTGGNDVLFGEKDADQIFGLAGNDQIHPRGGNDIVTFGTGSDTLFFDTALAGNKDTITDFNHAADTIKLAHAIFTKLPVGPLNPAFFHLGLHAADANDYIVYNQPTGALIYDFNGSAAGGEVQFATFSNHVALATNDFIVI